MTRRAIETFLTQRVEAASKASPTDIALLFPQSDRWLSSLLLSHIFTLAVPAENLPLAIQFVRRAESALKAYSALCSAISQLSQEPKFWSPYFSALSQAEIATSSLYQARFLAAKKFGLKAFEKGDGSELQRLNELYNAIKHVPANDKDPVWLSETGIECTASKLSYSEFEEVLGRSAGLAQSISGIDR